MALRDNLVSWWELNETSGTRADAHASNDLTDNNTVGSSTGKQGNAASFVKANSEYLSLADVADLRGTGAFSISMWINPSDLSGTTSFVLCAKENGSAQGWKMRINHTVKVLYFFGDEGASGTLGPSTTVFSTSTWYHIVVTVDASGNATMYINGSSEDTSTSFAVTSSTADMWVANSPFRNTRYYDGLIDEFAIWTRELTSAEVTELYNSGNGLSYADTADVVPGYRGMFALVEKA